MHDSNLQPSRLQISGPAGPIASFDRRALKKFDNTVRRADFASLNPGKELALFDAAVERDLRWGPYEYHLKPAEYRVEIVFQSVKNRFYDDESGATHRMKDVWIGTLQSSSATIHVR